MNWRLLSVVLALLGTTLLGACDGPTDVLAPYEGHRPLVLLRVTQSFTPDVQWVGGRVAAVGVNRGSQAALDSTLVWLMTSGDNDIDSYVTVGENTADALVRQFGGTPVDSLADEQEYTFWLAEKEAFDAGLAPGKVDAFTFADTTVTMSLVVKGTARGGERVDFRIIREERLLGTRYVVNWTPATKAFRRVAIRKGAGSPAFTDLVWHVVQPDGEPDAIRPPLVIGETPPGTTTAIEWPETGFVPDSYVLWLVDSTWNGSYGIRTAGLAYFVMFQSNFE